MNLTLPELRAKLVSLSAELPQNFTPNNIRKIKTLLNEYQSLLPVAQKEHNLHPSNGAASCGLQLVNEMEAMQEPDLPWRKAKIHFRTCRQIFLDGIQDLINRIDAMETSHTFNHVTAQS